MVYQWFTRFTRVYPIKKKLMLLFFLLQQLLPVHSHSTLQIVDDKEGGLKFTPNVLVLGDSADFDLQINIVTKQKFTVSRVRCYGDTDVLEVLDFTGPENVTSWESKERGKHYYVLLQGEDATNQDWARVSLYDYDSVKEVVIAADIIDKTCDGSLCASGTPMRGGTKLPNITVEWKGNSPYPYLPPLKVERDGMSGVNVHMVPIPKYNGTTFRFTPEAAGTKHVPGQGFGELVVNGRTTAQRMYCNVWHLSTPCMGNYHMRMYLRANSGSLYAVPPTTGDQLLPIYGEFRLALTEPRGGGMNHSGMGGGDMKATTKAGGMDHSGMNHGNHGGMDHSGNGGMTTTKAGGMDHSGHDGMNHGSGHGGDGSGHGAMGKPFKWDGAEKIDHLDLRIIEEKDVGYTVLIDTNHHFNWDYTDVNKKHVPSSGHAHIYLDGVKLARIYCNAWFIRWDEVSNPARSKVKVTLYNNFHMTYTQEDGTHMSVEKKLAEASKPGSEPIRPPGKPDVTNGGPEDGKPSDVSREASSGKALVYSIVGYVIAPLLF